MPRRAAAALLSLLPATLAQAASTPLAVGPQFRVNSYTTNAQQEPALAMAADGAFVVVWHSDGSSGGDTASNSIQGQRYSAAGIPLGPQFQVNSYTTGSQAYAAVAVGPDGGSVIVWNSDGSSGGDTSSFSIQGQRYSPMGMAQGPQFQVNSYTTGAQAAAAVAIDRDGRFVVVWHSNGSSGGDTAGDSIQGQRYSAAGVGQGPQVQVNSYTTGSQGVPAVAVDDEGNFVVVWQSAGSDGSDGGSLSVQGQRYSAAGVGQGTQFQVNGYTTGFQSVPAVAVAPDGRFVVAWHSDGSSGGDTSSVSVQAQRYAADGTGQGPQLQVNTYTTNAQRVPATATDADGDFVVVWDGMGSSGGDDSSILGQRFSAAGFALGAEFQVNSYTTNQQDYPAVAMDADGDFVVVWDSYGSSNGDLSGDSIQGQRFRVTGDLDGTVFFDQDFDGLQDGDEPGIPGVAVELYDDTLTLRRTTVTDGNGNYAFRPKEGSWHLRVVRPTALSFTGRDVGGDDGIDSDVDPLTGESDPFVIEIDLAATPLDAGLTNGIGDKVWNDLDHDGLRDGGEPGMAGVTVRLRDKGGSEIASTTTDGAGFYHVNGMAPGFYYVEFVAPAGFAFSPANQGGNDDADSDADEVTGTTPVFTFSLAEIDTSLDAGLYQRSSIGGRVWDDLDRDGLRDGGEPGIDNVLVRLLDATGTTVLASQATIGGGFYAFEDLASATYVIEVVPLGAIDLSPQDQGGDDTIDSDFDPATARTAPTPFTAGTVVANVDAGLQVVVLLVDGFESGDLSRWSASVP